MAQDVDVKTIQTRMDHASANTTLNFYSHPVEENDERAAWLVGSLLSGGGSPGLETPDSLANAS